MSEDKMDIIIANQREIIALLRARTPEAAPEDFYAAEIRRMRQAGASIEEITDFLVAHGKIKPKRQYRRKETRA